MPQLLTIIPSKAERIKQLEAIKKIKELHKQGDHVQILINGKPVRMPC